MTLTELAQNYKAFPPVDVGANRGDYMVDDMLAALFSEVVRPRAEQFIPELLAPERIALHEVVGTYQGGMHILVVDEKPVAVFLKALGGHEESQVPFIVDAETFAALSVELVVAETKKRLATVELASETPLCKLDSPFLHFLGKKGTMFAVHNPQEQYHFAQLLNGRRGYFVSSDGTAREVKAILEICDEASTSVELVDGSNVKVDASQLMFELVPGKGDIEDALAAYADDPHWVVTEAHHHALMVSIITQRLFYWSSTLVLVQFDTEAEYSRFCDAYPVGNKKEHCQKGVFAFKELGFEGRLISD